MSKISLAVSSTPSVPVQFNGNTGVAVPIGNVLNIIGVNGFLTSGSGSTITLTPAQAITNGTGTTAGGVTTTLVTFTPTTGKAVQMRADVIGYDSANSLSVGGTLIAIGHTEASVTALSGTQTQVLQFDGALSGATFAVTASGATFLFRATGVAAHTIAWSVSLTYLYSP